MSSVLVTGATGLLGRSLVAHLRAAGHAVVEHGFAARADVHADLRSASETAAMLTQVRPTCIINLAALTNVDACEADPHRAYLLNVASVENICQWIRQERLVQRDCHLIQISSDQLYDGPGPHHEAQVTIRNCYAFSKIAAELAAASVPSTILRTNFFGPSRCPGRSSFSDWIYQSLKQDLALQVFEDVLFSPLSIDSLSGMIERVLEKKPQGTFNLGSREGLSKADFAFAFAEALALPTRQLRRSQSAEMAKLKAYRPKDMRMDSRRFEQKMNLSLPTLADEILSMRSAYHEAS